MQHCLSASRGGRETVLAMCLRPSISQTKANSKQYPEDTTIQMQRLVDKIVNEFQQNSDYIEIGALDGNGGSVEHYCAFRFLHLTEPNTEHRFLPGLSGANKNFSSVSFCKCSPAPKLFLFLLRIGASQCDLT